MKITIAIFYTLIGFIVRAQTTEFSITGNIKAPVTFSVKSTTDYTIHSLDSLIIYNHLHEKKRGVYKIKGILLKDILEKATLNEESAKYFSEFYFTCVATDGYKVVYSWNELFNTEVGDHVLVVTEIDGKKADATGENIIVLSSADKATGRRFIKNLQEIKVERVK